MKKTFGQFVSKFLHIKQQMADDLAVSVGTIERWASGVSNPHPLIKSAVWKYLCEQEIKEFYPDRKEKELQIKIQIEDILSKFDPQGLIAIGAPKDEYASEAEDIANHLFMVSSLKELQKALWAVFICSFNVLSAGEIEDYEIIAKEIWALKV